MRRLVVLVVSTVLLMVITAGMAVAQGIGAKAELKDTKGKDAGSAQLTEDPGGVALSVEAKGLEKGEHGIHFHEKGECSTSDSFKSAGEHFNPEDKKHGLENSEGPHAGDLPNLKAKEDGTATYQATTKQVTLKEEGKTSVFDSDGTALVIHEKSDDQKTDPSGESGDRVACGEVEKAEGLPKSGGASLLPLAVFLGVTVLGAGMLLVRRAVQS